MCAQYKRFDFSNNKIGFMKCYVNEFHLLKYFVVVIVLFVKCTEAKGKVCKNFESMPTTGLYEERVPTTYSDRCPPSASPYNIYVVENDPGLKVRNLESSIMLVCWTNDVRRFALQFHDHVLLDTSTSGPVASVRTCALPNDTVHFSRRLHGTNNYKLLLNLSTASSKTFRAYFDTKRGQSHHLTIRTYNFDTDSKRRFSRSVNDGLGLTDIAECGVTRSCVRYGEEGCTQFTCDYFLSTNVSGRLVDVEMSAKTSGWVALGVSSDDKMGGDEVTACFKSDPTSLNVEATVFENPYMHDHPKRLETDAIKLKQSTIQDGYIYCRLSRPESYQSLQDLSAKWFQLYATGHVSQSGSLEKHRVTPKVSSKMVSFLSHYNILNGAFIVKPYGYLYVYFITILTTCILYH